MTDLRVLTLIVLAVAALLRSEIFFYLLYLLIALQAAAWLWVRGAARQIVWTREAPAVAFPNEEVQVRITVRNGSRLPVPWLSVHESVPAALRTTAPPRQVISLGAREHRVIRYTVQGRRRGLYQLGPLSLRTGDVLGLQELPLRGSAADALTIYPQILPLPELGLPAGLPFGAEARPRSLFTDPARPIGVRPYLSGDSVRTVDWKSSARAGALQVRRHEPAIARETLVALAFGQGEYPGRFAFDARERAVVAAASIAADLIERRQPVGLCTNGRDPLREGPAEPIGPGTGRPHLIRLLGLLGRLEPAPDGDLAATLDAAAPGLGWGATVILVTANGGRELVARLLPLRRRGLGVALVLVEGRADEVTLARRHGIGVYLVDRSGLPEPTA